MQMHSQLSVYHCVSGLGQDKTVARQLGNMDMLAVETNVLAS